MMHAIADYVVDHYLDVTNLIEADIDNLEEVAFTPATSSISNRFTCSSVKSSNCADV
ncbi:putative MAGNESIUM AND COBALT TRANSPORT TRANSMEMBRANE PROTEIN CORA domain protein [Mycobacterium xenopi 4042]|uniref:Putative MAGNESIUM AND COBALT TRANSPORT TRANSMEMBRANE PROTEIN CORA domain protein n=1 Tax=Mycobacterium xenopi 4042 TaxID=1299334 RepID=X8E0B9_MYCXE|nr:putative MAGNESIUM AND COBALT TRANSPORT TRANSMEMBRANE PROTEIN CORA domain protein [Mycobacterium xenopi 4042]